MEEIIVTREEIFAKNIDNYTEVLKRESHHDHEIAIVNNVLRWKKDETLDQIVDSIGLNDISVLFQLIGIDKNSEEYRAMYRGIGYSLSGYWEIFYWELNNENCDQYNPNNIKLD